MPIHIVNKPIGYTPKQIIDIFKEKFGLSKMSFCGRLDPMASGIMMLLSGDDIKNQEDFIKLNKIYNFDLILGIGTDTYDILGIPFEPIISDKDNENEFSINSKINKLNAIIKELLDNPFIQEYPSFSSICVRHSEYGRKPLWWYAKNNKLTEINIPSKEVCINKFAINNYEIIKLNDLLSIIKHRLSLLQDNNNNFRQNEVIKYWVSICNEFPNYKIIKINCTCNVSSGCYIRSIANEIGNKLGTRGLALDIKRIQLGEYNSKDL